MSEQPDNTTGRQQFVDAETRIREALRAARVEQGVTQKELGQRVGLSEIGVYRTETGQSPLTISKALCISHALGRTLTNMLQQL